MDSIAERLKVFLAHQGMVVQCHHCQADIEVSYGLDAYQASPGEPSLEELLAELEAVAPKAQAWDEVFTQNGYTASLAQRAGPHRE